MKKPWWVIGWFTFWGLFQAYAVASIFAGTWSTPEAFSDSGAYLSLIYPDMVFIPLYLATALLLWRGHWSGYVTGLVSSGGVTYVMIYLLALAQFSGALNLRDFRFSIFDLRSSIFDLRRRERQRDRYAWISSGLPA